MAVDSKHPAYVLRYSDWVAMRDAHEGERAVKDKGEEYLPATSGQRQLGMGAGQLGRLSYDAYKIRASFPDIVSASVEAMLGVMHHKPAVIELPAKMEPMLESATLNGESLQMLLRRINEEQLVTGRLGLLLDVEDGAPPDALPYIAMYCAEHILNWDDGTRDGLVLQNLNLVVLDESEYERNQDFEWELINKYRVLTFGEVDVNEGSGAAGAYQAGVFRDAGTQFNPQAMVVPSIAGKRPEGIPFVFINSKDVVTSPDRPPLRGLADLAFLIYRGEADYRQALFMQGQSTLVVTGSNNEDASYNTGANSVINLPTGADAKFIGVDASGISEMREALQNDKSGAAQRGSQLLDSVSRERESGDALKIRVAARTATLNQIALTGAFGLQTLLRQAAMWVGADPEAVTVTPNLDFADDELSSKSLVEYMTAKSLGLRLSHKSVHRLMQEKGVTENEYEDELEEIREEADELPELEPAAGDGEDEPLDEEPAVEEEDAQP